MGLFGRFTLGPSQRQALNWTETSLSSTASPCWGEQQQGAGAPQLISGEANTRGLGQGDWSGLGHQLQYSPAVAITANVLPCCPRPCPWHWGTPSPEVCTSESSSLQTWWLLLPVTAQRQTCSGAHMVQTTATWVPGTWDGDTVCIQTPSMCKLPCKINCLGAHFPKTWLIGPRRMLRDGAKLGLGGGRYCLCVFWWVQWHSRQAWEGTSPKLSLV